MFTDIAWMSHAACRTADPELFFPIGQGPRTPIEVSRARAVCRRCPVQTECLRYSLETAQKHGIWGGTDEDERRLLRAAGRV